jgi:hypothetical protein
LIIKVKTIPYREKVAGNLIPLVFAFLFFLNLHLFPQQALAQSDSIQNSILDTKVTLSLQNTSIQTVLDTLSSYPNVKFSYVNYDLPLQDKINIQTKDQALKFLLDSIFEPYGIKYYMVSRQIVLKKEKKPLGLKDKLFAPSSHRKIFISFYGSIGSSYRRLRSNNPVLIEERNKDEKSIRNFSAGGYISYQYLPSIILRSGIALSNTGEKGTYSYMSNDTTIAGNNGNGNGSGNGNGNGNNIDSIGSPITGSYKNKYNYMTIPLMIGYTAGKQKMHFSVFTGIGMGFFLSYSSTFPSDINDYQNSTAEQKISSIYQKDANTHSYRKIVLSIPVIAEIEYLISHDLGLFGAIGFNYFTSSIYNSKENVKHRPYYVNVAIGLTYHLPKAGK